MICQDCAQHPASEDRRIWKPVWSGAALRWYRLTVCAHCYSIALSNSIKHPENTGRSYQRVCIGTNINEVPRYGQVEI